MATQIIRLKFTLARFGGEIGEFIMWKADWAGTAEAGSQLKARKKQFSSFLS